MTTIDFNTLDDEERARFTAEFIRISGIDDRDSPMPWCAPWTWMKAFTVESDTSTVEEFAAAYYEDVRADIDVLWDSLCESKDIRRLAAIYNAFVSVGGAATLEEFAEKCEEKKELLLVPSEDGKLASAHAIALSAINECKENER